MDFFEKIWILLFFRGAKRLQGLFWPPRVHVLEITVEDGWLFG